MGDAAGYVEPFTGEGIAWALASAVALAPFVRRAAEGWTPDLIGRWRRRLDSLLGGRRRSCWLLTRVLRRPALVAALVRLLAVIPALSRPVVARLNRRLGNAKRGCEPSACRVPEPDRRNRDRQRSVLRR